MIDPLTTGATIGNLGGGQLGRILSVAAARLGFKTCIFKPGSDCPTSHVTNYHYKADYSDTEALTAFAKACDITTFEFENIPAEALDTVEAITTVLPNRNALATSQDCFIEKNFLTRIGLQTAPMRLSQPRKTCNARMTPSQRTDAVLLTATS